MNYGKSFDANCRKDTRKVVNSYIPMCFNYFFSLRQLGVGVSSVGFQNKFSVSDRFGSKIKKKPFDFYEKKPNKNR